MVKAKIVARKSRKFVPKNVARAVERRYGNRALSFRQELKAFDVPFQNSDFTLVGTVTLLNGVINGTDIFNRIGRKIYMKSIHIRGTIQNAATSVEDELRIVLVYDRQPDGVIATGANILQDSTVAAATTSLSSINLANRDRFLVLRDMMVTGPACSNAVGVLTNYTIPDPIHNSFNINWFVKLRALETIYNGGNAGTSADQSTGSILLLTMSSAASAKWTLSYQSRLRYTD